MGYIVRMPKLGLEMERGTLLEWHVESGESIEEGDLVAEVESEKSVGEVDAREDGVLRRTYLEAGAEVPPGTPIGIVAPEDESIDDLEAEAEADLDLEEGSEADAEETAEPGSVEAGRASTAAADESTAGGDDGDVRASPRARERAKELGVALETVEGTGYQGAITEDDVEAAAEAADVGQPNASPRARKRAEELGVDLASVEGTGYQSAITEDDVEAAAEAAETAAGGRTLAEERAFDGMRRTIASRLSESYREAVHVTVHREADAEALFAAVDAADDALETDVSLQDLLLLAVSATLEDHSAFNATFEDDAHRIWAEHNLGVAVDVEQGLIAPVLRDVGSKSLSEVAEERRDLVDDALSGDYTMDDLRGGTFTVTNLGVLGVESFDPIINPPQVAILGVDAIEEEPVRTEAGDVEWRRHLPLDLSFDHRVVDGADAARFLETLVGHLEEPTSLLPAEVDLEAGGATAAGIADGAGSSSGTTGSSDGTEMPGRTVTATNPDGMRGRIEAGSFEWGYDEPADRGGTETDPTPVDVFLGGLASCLSLSTRYQADKRDADVGEISVTTDADPEHGSVESIEATIHLESDEDDETVERIVELGERGCHVSQLLREDLELDLSWDRH
ncbi:dihydrolipoyllysine acetyltransferase [Halobiforma lacisalsi AJ5]|uniref:Branched-chain alpha-keto acid dehydrogenase subunit E2 n=1 Tax=Natronobacterium lacisalsi AJ5 TaxID=358396 RepID=M0LU57_NATLA|nr:2-oxo acid dehydrogenase subunit E2 [Halobiforma lacisalsi]APW99585.1 dihydrolipoyllysine acetyltransferase [Halobiforma lacisalsi AJ5]EMA35630.1 branched-chain alpha-keto acid dehydrogenase subunit E2 [Halobiforma lacisalsi AJ5]